jgi:hypothetical protein
MLNAGESLIYRTDFRADGQWGTDRKEKGNKVLRLYQKTRWFWIILVFVDLATQACKTADSDEATLSLLRESHQLRSHRNRPPDSA